MKLRHLIAGVCVVAALGGCAIKGTPILSPDQLYDPDELPQPPSPLVESPPLEPVEPAIPAVAPPASNAATDTGKPSVAATPAPNEVPQAAGAASGAGAAATTMPNASNGSNGQGSAAGPGEASEDQQMLRLLADLQRYGTLQADELKRELATATTTLAQQRSDMNRIRLAVLYTMLRSSPQDDQRALQLLETVARTSSAAPAVRNLAAVLQAQVVERQRAVKYEQQKGDAAVQKLEALRAMEQSLFRDRVRSGGDGGGGGGGGGGGSGR